MCLLAYNSSIQTVFIQNKSKMVDGQSLRCSYDDKKRYVTYIHHWIEPYIPWQYVLILVNSEKTCSVSQEELNKHRLFHFLLWHSWPLVKRISSVTTSSSHCRKKKLWMYRSWALIWRRNRLPICFRLCPPWFCLFNGKSVCSSSTWNTSWPKLFGRGNKWKSTSCTDRNVTLRALQLNSK